MSKPLLILPLAGMGLRFSQEGYKIPKQLLKVDRDISCIEKTISSIKNIKDFNIISYVRDPEVGHHLNQILKKLNVNFCVIDGKKTKSPVNTLKNILDTAHEFINHDPYVFVHTLDIDIPGNFNIDPKAGICTYVFKANSSNYSYVGIKERVVNKIYDQREIGDLANVGIYGFGKVSLINKYCEEILSISEVMSGEIPLVDLFKLYIRDSLEISSIFVPKIYIFGTPSEYLFCKKYIYELNNTKKCYVISDHSGTETRTKLITILSRMNMDVLDLGTFDSEKDCDYTECVEKALVHLKNNAGYIFASCSTGQGVNIALNKHKHVISSIIYNPESFKLAIEHNCSNAFSFPNSLWKEIPLDFIENIFKKNSFDGGRHQNRVMTLTNGDSNQ
jgi:ribose 5-phosphate isomerase B